MSEEDNERLQPWIDEEAGLEAHAGDDPLAAVLVAARRQRDDIPEALIGPVLENVRAAAGRRRERRVPVSSRVLLGLAAALALLMARPPLRLPDVVTPETPRTHILKSAVYLETESEGRVVHLDLKVYEPID